MRTLKKQIILGLATATDLEVLKNNKLFLVTPIGIISGRPCDENNTAENVDGASFLSSLTEKLVEDFDSENIEGNDGFLTLTDVTVQMAGNFTYSLPHLVVFYDQIIGVTLGNNA